MERKNYGVFVGKTSKGRNKSYFVASWLSDASYMAYKALKVTARHIMVRRAWLVGDDLYFEDPHIRGQIKVYAGYYIS